MTRLTLSTTVQGVRVAVRPHAIDRYRERVRSAASEEQATAELLQLLALEGRFGPEPEWKQSDVVVERWVLLGDAIAFPVVDGRLTTCMARGSVGAQVRVVRQERKHRPNPQGRGNRKKRHGKVARAERRRARDAREAMGDG